MKILLLMLILCCSGCKVLDLCAIKVIIINVESEVETQDNVKLKGIKYESLH